MSARKGPRVEHYTAPSAWASGLINGDWSGLEDQEEETAKAWESSLPGYIVDATDAGFLRWHDATGYLPLAADCQTYTIHIQQEST